MKLKRKMAWLLSLCLLFAVTLQGNTLTARADSEIITISFNLSIGLEEGTSADHYGVSYELRYTGDKTTTISGGDTWSPVTATGRVSNEGSSQQIQVSIPAIPQEDMNDYTLVLSITNAGKNVIINGAEEGEISSKSYSIGELQGMSSIAITLRDPNQGGGSGQDESEVFVLVWQGADNGICFYKVTLQETVQQIPLSSVKCFSTGQAYSLSADHEWIDDNQLFDVLSRFDGNFSGYRAWLNELDEDTMHSVTVDPGHISKFVAVIYDDTPASEPAPAVEEQSSNDDDDDDEEEPSVTVSNEEGTTVTVSDTSITVVNSDGVAVTKDLHTTAAVTTSSGAAVAFEVAAKTDGSVSGGIITQNLGAIKVNGGELSLAGSSLSMVAIPASTSVNNAVNTQVRENSEFRNRVVTNQWTFDITMMAGNTRVSDLSAPVRFTIQRPAGSNATNDFKVVRVHGAEVTTLPDLDNDPNTITFETDRFSSYAVVEVATTTSAKTGEEGTLPGIPFAALPASILGIAGFAVVGFRRKKDLS